MKVIFLFVVLVFSMSSFSQVDPVVMEIDGKGVSKSEFLQIYLKNNKNPKYDKTTIDEYMVLFRKFKLKVAEAERLGYDTIPKLVKELEGYKRQLASPYLVDSSANNELVREAYERMKTEIRASHILIRCGSQATPEDTLKAYNKIMSCLARINKGEPFETVAKSKNGSEDPSVEANGGDLGYFTAFQMVYPFEDMAYNTEVGTISKPVRTRFGYHLIKVTDKRPARGKIKTAHIMIQSGSKASAEEDKNAEIKINEIYKELTNGAKWEEMVKKYSEDPGSVKNNGELPEFGSGTTQRMVPEFEDAAFALKKTEEFSKPIKTAYGYHIIKRISWSDIESFETIKKSLQAKVNKDVRAKKTQDSFVEKLKNLYGYTFNAENLKALEPFLDSTYFIGKWKSEVVKSSEILFSLDKAKVQFTQKDFALYLERSYRGIKRQDVKNLLNEQYAKFEKESILKYEESQLEEKYPEYKALLKEYHDGIILYEIMSDEVWTKATKDTSGLREFFTLHKGDYMWPERIDATIYESNDIKKAKLAYRMLGKKKNTSKEILGKINADSPLNISVRVNKFVANDIAYLSGREFKKGRNKPYSFEDKYYVVHVSEKLPVMPKDLSETRGVVTSDYQEYLEKTWLESLEKNHSIKINYDVLYNLNK